MAKTKSSKEEVKVKKVKTQKEEITILPKTLFGKNIPTTLNDEDKKKRKFIYLKESLLFGFVMVILDLILLMLPGGYNAIKLSNNETLNIILTVTIDYFSLFVISYIFDFFVGEQNIKRYNLQNKTK